MRSALPGFSDVFPFVGGGSLTPARRAFESPMAIACFVDRAPCLPLRMWCISSRTNSLAWVVGAFPSCRSLRARFNVCFSGMACLPLKKKPASTKVANVVPRTMVQLSRRKAWESLDRLQRD
jgi:hypothetical protein